MKTSAILRKAGDVLRDHGWRQGWFSGADGRVCAIGALRVAEHGNPETGIEDEEPRSFLRLTVGSHFIVSWNDTPGRTAEEVQIAMDAAYVLALQLEGDEPDDFEAL